MKTIAVPFALLILVSSGGLLRAQEKAKPEETEKAAPNRREITPLRVQVVFTEYEGEKKISNLPYTLLVNAEGARGQKAAIRMGLRVPVATSANSNQFQYIDVGTNMDGWATKLDDGRFLLHLNLERSSSYTSSATQKTSVAVGEPLSNQPIIQQFKTEVDLLMRDGQTIQSTLATEPVSARVSKIEVTLNVVK